MNRLSWLLTASLLFTGSAFTFQDQNQAELLYSNAATFISAGKHKEGLADYEKIVRDFPGGPWAPRALLAMGKHHLLTEENPEAALGYFVRIQDEYGQSDAAPAAYYFKARIIEREADDRETLSSALADLVRMMSLYGPNQYADEALFLAGKISMRLDDHTQALGYLQRLEFFHPKSSLTPASLVLGARVALASGNHERAALMLARVQAGHPSSNEAKVAEALFALMDRFNGQVSYSIDRGFPGAAPKKYRDPYMLGIDADEVLAVAHREGVQMLPLMEAGQAQNHGARDIEGMVRGRDGGLLYTTGSGVSGLNVADPYGALSVNGTPLRDIQGIAVDHYGRLYAADDDLRTVVVFSDKGNYIDKFGGRSRNVAATGNVIWVVGEDGDAIRAYNDQFQRLDLAITGLDGVEDFTVDQLGNLYVLHDRGERLWIYDRLGTRRATLDLENSSYPLKRAEAVAVDHAGRIYLADRRGGSVYRFH